MAEDTDIDTPEEVADSFGRQENENLPEGGDIDINEELARMNAKFRELETSLNEIRLVASEAEALADLNKTIIANNEKNIDVLDSAFKNTKGATDATKVSFDSDGSLVIDGASFSGTAYVSGIKTTNLNGDSTKPWIKVDVTTALAEEETGPPSNPFPPNQEWYEKAYTYGDIHVTRF